MAGISKKRSEGPIKDIYFAAGFAQAREGLSLEEHLLFFET